MINVNSLKIKFLLIFILFGSVLFSCQGDFDENLDSQDLSAYEYSLTEDDVKLTVLSFFNDKKNDGGCRERGA